MGAVEVIRLKFLTFTFILGEQHRDGLGQVVLAIFLMVILVLNVLNGRRLTMEEISCPK